MLTELTYTIDEELDEKFKRELLFDALSDLTPRDEKILRHYFGIDTQPRTMVDIGNMFGITRERVQQLRDRAIKRLSEGVYGYKLESYVKPISYIPPKVESPPPSWFIPYESKTPQKIRKSRAV